MAGNDKSPRICVLCQRPWQRTEKYLFCAFSATNSLCHEQPVLRTASAVNNLCRTNNPCRTNSLCREQLGVLLPSRQCSLPGRVTPTSVDPSVWGRAMRRHMRNHKVLVSYGHKVLVSYGVMPLRTLVRLLVDSRSNASISEFFFPKNRPHGGCSLP